MHAQKRKQYGGVKPNPGAPSSYVGMSTEELAAELFITRQKMAFSLQSDRFLTRRLRARQKELFRATTYRVPITRELLEAGHAERALVLPLVLKIEADLAKLKSEKTFLTMCIRRLGTLLAAKEEAPSQLLTR